jgi:hypothetical protein
MKVVILAAAVALMTACTANTKPLTPAQQASRSYDQCIENASRHASSDPFSASAVAMGCHRTH